MKRLLLFVLTFLWTSVSLWATHIVGGTLTYVYNGGSSYTFTLKLYRDCTTGTAAFPGTVTIAVRGYDGATFAPSKDFTMNLGPVTSIPSNLDTCAAPPNPMPCVQEGIYTTTVNNLPPAVGGYHCYYQVCCRNLSTTNVNASCNCIGASVSTDIPGYTRAWLEDFTLANGTTVDAGSTAWTRSLGTTPPTSAQVNNNLFEVIGANNGQATWLSQQINISSMTSGVNLSVDLSEAGTLDVNDSIRTYYSINSGPFVPFTTNGAIADDFTSAVATSGPVTGNTVQILIRAHFDGASPTSEIYRWDNVLVYGNDFVSNSSPVFTAFPPLFLCQGNFFSFNHAASDPNGDSLAYSFYTPFTDAAPTYSNNVISFTPVTWLAGYSATNPLGGTPLSLNGTTGLLTGTPPNTGQFIVGVQVKEYRNGRLLSTTYRDFQFNVVFCPPPAQALIVPGNTMNACSGLSVSFPNNSSANANNWYWNFGDGATLADTSHLQYPTYSYPTPGTYNVVMITNKGTPCADTSTASVFVGYAIANFSHNAPKCAGQNVTFTNLSSCSSNTTISGYQWNFGDAQTSTATNPTHAYATGGTYNVTLITNTALGCSDTTVIAVTINPTPTTPAPTSNSPVCSGNTLNLNTPAVSGGTYAWTGPNAFSSTLQNPSIANATTAATGTYSVTATAGGCTSAVGTVAVTVNPTPVAPTASNNSPICIGSTLTLSANTVAGATYSWTGPNGFTSSLQNPSIAGATAAASGTYSVTVTVNGCTGPAGTTVATVSPTPATPTASSNSPICAGSTLNLTASAVAGATYTWTGPNGFTSATQNPSIAGATTAATGTYSVTATVAGCTGAAGTTAVTVNPVPSAPTAGSNSPICAGSTLNLTASTIAGATYSWTGPNTFTSTSQNPTIASTTTAASGTYSVTATVAGCTSVAGTTAVTVNPAPAAPTAGSNSPICAGSTLNLTASNIAGATYNWSGPNSFTSATQNPSIAGATTAASGTYSVTATVAGCAGPAGTVAVTVNPIPAAPTAGSNSPICAGSTLNLTASTIAGATYNWSGPNTFTSTSQNPTIAGATTAASGTYSVTATVAGCAGPAGTVAVTVNPIPSAPTASSNSPICAGSSLNLTASTIAGATYAWTGPNAFTSSTQNPTIAGATTAASGTYSVTATVAGCTGPAGTTAVTVNPIPAAPTASSNSPICAGSTLNLNSTLIAGATYSWTGPNGFTASTQNTTLPGATTAATGTYSVTATVAGCTGPAGTVAVTVNPIPSPPTAGSNSPVCAGTTISLTSTTVAGATYSWTGPSAFASTLQNPNRTNATLAMGGTYSVTVTVAGCTSSAATTTVVVNPTPVAPTAGSNSPICAGSTLNLTASNIAGATYAWTGPNGFTSATQNPSIAGATTAASGTYSVTATVGGCTGPAGTVAVTVNPIPAAPTAASNSPICAGSTLNLTASTIAGATYSWTGPNSFTSATQNPTIAGATTAASGTYSVTATVAGCAGPAGTVAVTVNPIPSAPTASSNSPICAGSSLNLSANTIAGATYSWTGPNAFTSATQNPSIASATTAASGTYSVTVTVLGCTGPAGTTAVTVNPIPAAPTASSNSPICAGSTLNLNSTLIAGATYSWTGPNGFTASTQNTTIPGATTAATGTYSVTATVAGCTGPAGTVAVTVNPIPSPPTAGSNSPVCTGTTISLTSTTVAGATYSWTGPSAFASTLQNPNRTNATLVMAGTYSVTVTVAGCTSSAATTTVVVNPTPAAPTASSNSPICAGSTLNLNASNIAGATYSWTGPNGFTASTQNTTIPGATTAATGTYSVNATVGGCTSANGTVAVTVNGIPAAPTASSNSPICAGSTLSLTASSMAGATYSWTGPNTFSSALQNPTIAGATTAATGTYSVTATVAGCTGSAGTVAVTVNPIPSAPTASSNSPICAGSTLNLNANTIAGATYSWTGPNGFSSTTQNPSIANATTAETGTYSVTATVLGCTSPTGTTAVTVNPIPATPTASSNSPICVGQTLNLTSSTVTGATYSWTGPNGFTSSSQNPSITNVTTAESGTYSVTATIAGCTGSAGTVAVTINSAPATPTAASNGPVCTGTTLNLTASTIAGATYSWTGPNSFTSTLQNPTIANVTAAAAGTYTVVANNGCASSPATVTVVVNATPVAPTAGSNSPLCDGSTLNLTASTIAGATYSWTGPNSFTSSSQNPSIAGASPAESGTYSVTATSAAGCTGNAGTVTVVVNPIPGVPTASSNSPICAGNTLNLTASTITGATYSWTGPNGFTSSSQNPSIAGATTAASGTYSVTATVAGCTGSAGTVAVTVNPIPSAPTASNNGPLCAGSPLNLNASTIAGATYSWIGPNLFFSTTQNPTIASPTTAASGTYSVTVMVNGCTSPAGTTAVTVNAIPATPNPNSNSPRCIGQTLNLTTTAVAGATYSWTGPNGFTSALQNPSITNVTTAATGTYSLVVTVNGCSSAVGTEAVVVNTPPSAPVASSNSPVCTGTTLSLSASTIVGVTYSWSGPNSFTSTQQNPNITNVTLAAAGTYTVIANNGCASTPATVSVVVNPTPVAPTAGSNSPICDGNTLNLTASTIAGATYSWTGPNGFTSSSQNPSIAGATTAATGTYSVTATSAAGCTGSAGTVAVTVNAIPGSPSPSSNTPVCTGDSIHLSTSTVAGATYSWTGPNGFTSSSQNPNIANSTLAAAGTYSLTVSVLGCGSSAGTTSVVVNPTPAAPSTSNNGPLCEGSTLNLNAGTVAGATYSWTGPNSFTDTQQNTSITNTVLADTGTYSVTVTVLGCTSAPGTTNVIINPIPATPASTSNSPVCVTQTLNFSTTAVTGATYSWTGPNGFTSALQNPSITNATTAATGTYSLVVTVNGCSSAVGTVAAAVNSSPATPTASSNSPVCTGTSLQLSADTITGATYSWVGPNGFTSTQQNPTISSVTLPAAGTYTVTANNGCSSIPTTVTVVVNPTPATPNPNSNSPICQGSNLNLTTGAVAGATYSWTGPNSFTSSTQNNSIPNATSTQAGTYSVTVTVNGCTSNAGTETVVVDVPAVVNAGADQSVCANNGATLLTGTSSTGSGAWSTSGSGTFAPNNTTLNPTYTPSNADTTAGSVTLTFTSSNNGACPSMNDQMIVTITDAPTVDGGANQTVCANNAAVALNGTFGVASGVSWSSSGTGTFTPNNTTANATYNPSAADISAGTVTLYINTTGNGTCLAAADSMVVTITPAPTANAGGNTAVCVNNPNVSLNGSTSTGTGTWSTSGSGTFSPNANTLNATYVPSGADIASGSVNLFLNTTNNGNCITVQDTMTVTFSQPPTVSAGIDMTVCGNNAAVALSGSSTTGSGMWTTSGSGTFTPNATTLNATYNPSSADTAAGSVTLTLTTTNNGGCISVNDQMVVTITDAPIADAGADQAVCANNAIVPLNGSFSIATGGTWSSTGTGTFAPSTTAMNATYTASAADTAAGSVMIILSTTGNGQCNPATDTMLVTIFDAPNVNAGPDLISCINSPNTPLNGASSTGSGTWTTLGTGTFSPNANTLNATYVPSAADTTNGIVTLILTSIGNGSCFAVNDTMNIQFAPVPSITVGPDQTVCANNASVLLSATSSTGTGIWTTSGSGTFSPSATTLNATYTPSAADTAAGSVTLSFAATNACTLISQNVNITITPAPYVLGGPDVYTCANNPNGSVSGYVGGGSSTGTWTTSGSGSFSPSNTALNATYSPSAGDILSGSVWLVLTSTGNANCLAAVDSVLFTITLPPTANAGADATACANNAVPLGGTITGGSGQGAWSTPNGNGTFSPSATALNATYTPTNSDTAISPVMIILTSTNNGGCFAAADTMYIQVNPGPIVTAGADAMVCANNPNVVLNGSITSASGGVWTTSGNGTFSPDSATMNATYIPDTADVNAGTVTLYLTTTGNGLCSAVTDSMIVTFTPAPIVAAGPSQIVCLGTTSVTLGGSVSGGSSTGQWTTNGDGTFSPNDSTLNASYVFGPADTAAGMVTLYLASTNNGNCLAVNDSVRITLTPVPMVMAGADTTICANSSGVTLNGQVIGTPGTGVWSTSGDGTFSPDSAALNATYIPGTADTAAGTVTLILTSTNACVAPSDTVVLTFAPAPIVAAGPDALICAGDVVALNGTSQNAGGVQWATTGDGTFAPSDTVANPVYTPGPQDTAAGSVTLAIMSTGNTLCSAVNDSMVIVINSKPNAGFASGPACVNMPVTFADLSTNTNGNIVSWSWTSGADTSSQQNPSFSFTSTGTHSVTLIVSTAAGCADTVVRTLTVNPAPQPMFTSAITCPTDLALTDSSLISGGSIVSWSWNLGDSTTSSLQNPTHTYADTGMYIVTLAVTSDSGCVSAFSDTLVFVPCANPEVNPPAVPTGFTPNGDGVNDVLYVKGGPFSQIDFRVYNEWGNLIFRSESQSIGWDGTFKSKAQPEGSYVWVINATTVDGVQVKGTGEVTLMR